MADLKVVRLDGFEAEAKPAPGVNPDIVEFFERQLQRARDGGIAGFAAMVMLPDGCYTCEYLGDVSVADMIGRVEILKHEMAARLLKSHNGS